MIRGLNESMYEILDAAEALVTGPDITSDDIHSIQQTVLDFATVIRCLVTDHSPSETLHQSRHPGLRCDFCDTQWPCREYRRLHQLLKDPNTIFSHTRALINKRYPQ